MMSSLATTLRLLGHYSTFLFLSCREPSAVAEVIVNFRVLGDDSAGQGAGKHPIKGSCLDRLSRDVPERQVVWSHFPFVHHA
jgi:hypothetical protein